MMSELLALDEVVSTPKVGYYRSSRLNMFGDDSSQLLLVSLVVSAGLNSKLLGF